MCSLRVLSVFLGFFLVVVCLVKYRNKIEIIADILEVAREGAKKTHIIYRGNLSFKLANAYLKAVLKAGLIVLNRKDRHYLLTEKGQVFLERFGKYCKYARGLEKQYALVRSEMTSLEQMCSATRLRINNGADGKSDRMRQIKSLASA